MWPDAEWCKTALERALGTIRALLRQYPVTHAHADEIAATTMDAVRDDLQLLRTLPAVFGSQREVSVWAAVRGKVEAVARAVRHPRVAGWFRELPTEHFRILWCCYVDRVSLFDLARMLSPAEAPRPMTQREARVRVRAAFTALQSLLLKEWPEEGAFYTFPEPEQLRALEV